MLERFRYVFIQHLFSESKKVTRSVYLWGVIVVINTGESKVKSKRAS